MDEQKNKGGRPKGSTNKFSTKTLMEKLDKKGSNPFDFWLDVMADEEQKMGDRLVASKEIAKYVLVPLEKQVESEITKDNKDSITELSELVKSLTEKEEK